MLCPRALEERADFVVVKPHFVEGRRRHLFVADVLHQDCVLSHAVGFRYGNSGRMEQLQSGEFVHEPGRMAYLRPESRFPVDSSGSAVIVRFDSLGSPSRHSSA